MTEKKTTKISKDTYVSITLIGGIIAVVAFLVTMRSDVNYLKDWTIGHGETHNDIVSRVEFDAFRKQYDENYNDIKTGLEEIRSILLTNQKQ